MTTPWSAVAAALRHTVPSYAEFCSQIVVADGKQAGQPLSVDGHPAQMALIQAFDSGRWRRFAWAKPVQDGGTLLMLVPLFRRAVVENQTVVLAYPTGDSAKDIWTTKVWPVLAAYGGQQPETGGGSKGGAARVVTLPGGGRFLLRAAGGRGESGQASVTGDALGADEVDDWPNLHRLELVVQRINESQDPLAIYCCTVKHDGTPGQPGGSLILALVGEGTDSRLEYPCRQCGLFTTQDWERYDLDANAYKCSCGYVWTEADRLESFTYFQVAHKNEAATMFSLRWSVLDSPRKSMREICDMYRRAQRYAAEGDHGPMRSFYRDRMTRPYTEDRRDEDRPHILTRMGLVARSEASPYRLEVQQRDEDGDSKHLAGHPPATIEYLTAGIDVQRGGERAPGRLYWSLQGAATDGGIWLQGWGSIRLSPIGQQPSVAQVHEGLDRLHRLLFQDPTPWPGPLVGVAVDVGDRQEELLPWILAHRSYHPIKGHDGRSLRAEMGDVDGWIYHRRQAAGWTLRMIPTRTVMAEVHASLTIPQGHPGAFNLPQGLTTQDAMTKHMVGTLRIIDRKMGERWSESAKDRALHPEWNKRIDYLHTIVYGRALGYAWRRLKQRPAGKPRKYGAIGAL